MNAAAPSSCWRWRKARNCTTSAKARKSATGAGRRAACCARGDRVATLILRSGLLAASRRMRPGLSWFETREDALLTMRLEYVGYRGKTDEPEKPDGSRLEQDSGADRRRHGGASEGHDDPADRSGRHRRYLGDARRIARTYRRIRLSPDRRARQDLTGRRLGHDPGRARLHAANLRVPRPVRRAESRRRPARVRPVDPEQRVPDRDGLAAAFAVPGFVR